MRNYYREIEELDGTLGREENCARLREAWHKWNKRSGARAQNQQNLIKETLGIFGDEQAYREYRSQLIVHELRPMIDVALADGRSLTTEQEKRIIEQALQQGLTEAEVRQYMHLAGAVGSETELSHQTASFPRRTPTVGIVVLGSVFLAIGTMVVVAVLQSQDQHSPNTIPPVTSLCTTTVSPGSSIQSAIDQAPVDSIICLGSGVWEENIRINRSLTLRGMDATETTIKSAQAGKAVLFLEGDSSQQVIIQAIAVIGARCQPSGECTGDGVGILGDLSVTIRNTKVSDNDRYGIGIWLAGQVNLQNSTISNNDGGGIIIGRTAFFKLQSSEIFDNGSGISIDLNSRVMILDNDITRNERYGIDMGAGPSSEVTIIRNRIGSNGYGISVSLMGDIRATIRENTINGNRLSGVKLYNATAKAGVATITNNTISDNLIDGITIGLRQIANDTLQSDISDNTIQSNRQCGISTDADPGITITGQANIISRNGIGNLCGEKNKFSANFISN